MRLPLWIRSRLGGRPYLNIAPTAPAPDPMLWWADILRRLKAGGGHGPVLIGNVVATPAKGAFPRGIAPARFLGAVAMHTLTLAESNPEDDRLWKVALAAWWAYLHMRFPKTITWH